MGTIKNSKNIFIDMGKGKLIVERLITEGRLEDVKAKYPGNDDQVDNLSRFDPSGNNKYLLWIAKQVFVNQNGMSEVSDVIQNFHDALGRFQKEKKSTDINSYKTLQDVTDAISGLKRRETPSKSKLKGLGKLIYDDEDIYIVRPLNYKGSCEFGTGAEWCIRLPDTDKYWRDYNFDDPNHLSVFYFAISKNLSTNTDNYKIAIQKKVDTGKNIYWDIPDNSSHTPQNDEITPEVLSVIDSDFVKAKEERFTNLLKGMLDGNEKNNVNNLKTVMDFAKDGQVYKLLMMEPKNLETELVFEEAMKKFGGTHMLKLLQQVPKDGLGMILTKNKKVIEWLSENVDDTIRRDLVRGVKVRSGNVSVIISKWLLTDEQINDYKTKSIYMIMGDKEGNTIRPMTIITMDRFNPKDINRLGSLKSEIRKKELKLFGLQTQKGMLDAYLGENPDLTKDVVKYISKNSQELPIN